MCPPPVGAQGARRGSPPGAAGPGAPSAPSSELRRVRRRELFAAVRDGVFSWFHEPPKSRRKPNVAAFLRTGLCPAFLGGPWVSTGRCTCQPGSATPLVSTECSWGLPGQACGSGRSAAALRGPSGLCARAGAAPPARMGGTARGQQRGGRRGAWQRTPRPRLRARASTRVHVACAHARACGACTCVRAQLNMSNSVTFSSGRGRVERHTTPSNGRAVTPRRPRHRRRRRVQCAGGHRPRGPTPLPSRARPASAVARVCLRPAPPRPLCCLLVEAGAGGDRLERLGTARSLLRKAA